MFKRKNKKSESMIEILEKEKEMLTELNSKYVKLNEELDKAIETALKLNNIDLDRKKK